MYRIGDRGPLRVTANRAEKTLTKTRSPCDVARVHIGLLHRAATNCGSTSEIAVPGVCSSMPLRRRASRRKIAGPTRRSVSRANAIVNAAMSPISCKATSELTIIVANPRIRT